jgi:hypothetical protein
MANPNTEANTSVVVSPGAATPATAEDFTKLKAQFELVVKSEVGKLVPVVTAFAVPMITALCAWGQKELGIKMDPAALTAFIASMGAGIVLTAYKWLSNRGTWERGIIDAYGVYLTGQSATSHQVVITPAVTPAAPAPAKQEP